MVFKLASDCEQAERCDATQRGGPSNRLSVGSLSFSGGVAYTIILGVK
jgi:hypothetical protein